VRAGAIVPLGPVREYTSQPVEGPLTLRVYPGRDGSFLLYEDDGRSFDHRKGQWLGMRIEWRDASRRLSLRLADGSRMLPPLRRPIEVHVAGTNRSKSVVFDGKPIEVQI
jgi:hypothetical protein